jgi:hypothetical protein
VARRVRWPSAGRAAAQSPSTLGERHSSDAAARLAADELEDEDFATAQRATTTDAPREASAPMPVGDPATTASPEMPLTRPDDDPSDADQEGWEEADDDRAGWDQAEDEQDDEAQHDEETPPVPARSADAPTKDLSVAARATTSAAPATSAAANTFTGTDTTPGPQQVPTGGAPGTAPMVMRSATPH